MSRKLTAEQTEQGLIMIEKGRNVRGEKCNFAKLTEGDVREIIELRQSGMTYKEIAALFNVDTTTPYKICHKKRWKHLHREAA